MTVVRDASRDVFTPVLPCKACGQPVYSGLNASGRRTPYEIDELGQPTRLNHHERCPGRKESVR